MRKKNKGFLNKNYFLPKTTPVCNSAWLQWNKISMFLDKKVGQPVMNLLRPDTSVLVSCRQMGNGAIHSDKNRKKNVTPKTVSTSLWFTERNNGRSVKDIGEIMYNANKMTQNISALLNPLNWKLNLEFKLKLKLMLLIKSCLTYHIFRWESISKRLHAQHIKADL